MPHCLHVLCRALHDNYRFDQLYTLLHRLGPIQEDGGASAPRKQGLLGILRSAYLRW